MPVVGITLGLRILILALEVSLRGTKNLGAVLKVPSVASPESVPIMSTVLRYHQLPLLPLPSRSAQGPPFSDLSSLEFKVPRIPSTTSLGAFGAGKDTCNPDGGWGARGTAVMENRWTLASLHCWASWGRAVASSPPAGPAL